MINMGYWKDLFKIKPVSDKRYIAGLIYIVVLILGLIGIMIIYINIATQPIPFEIEGSCNTGKINLDFDAEFRNQAYQQKTEIWQTQLRETSDNSFSGLSNTKNIYLTKYNIEFFPKSISLDGLENLNCYYKIKGAIPKNLILAGGLLQ